MAAVIGLLRGAHADDSDINRDTFGEVGLLEMPSAHMAPDGQFAVSVADVGQSQRYSFSFQRKSWLEGTFRYSHVVGLYPGYNDKHFFDRSFALKIKLLDEDEDLMPDVSVGIRDIIGTGVFSSEYVAASKHFGPLDLSFGLGWGELAEDNTLSNPIGHVFSSFNTRPTTYVTTGGLPNVNQYFRGPTVGVFGGGAWQTPIDGLSLLAEYSSLRYNGYVYDGGIKVRSPVNVGLSYRPLQFFAVSAGWFYGSTYGLTVTLNADPTTTYPSAIRIGAPIPPAVVRTDVQQQSALRLLHTRSRSPGNGPWVNVPTPEARAKQDVLQALYSAGRGVRDVDIDGKSLVVDANLSGDPSRQCANYAQIAAINRLSLTSVALTDLQNPDGRVTFCSLPAVNAEQIATRRDQADDADHEKLAQSLLVDLGAQGIKFNAVSLQPPELWIYYENYKYYSEAEAMGRIAHILTADAPPSVEIFHLVSMRWGMPIKQVTIMRSAYERTIVAHGSAVAMGDALSIEPAPMYNPAFDAATSKLYPSLSWSLDPKVAEHMFDPDNPLQFMIYGDAAAVLQLAPGLLIGTELTGTIWTNYTFTRPAGSDLPHVRTDLLQYLKHGKYGISNLVLDYRTRLAPEVFAEGRVGYLEDMFMGAGGQVLWRPQGSRFALGVDLYQVWKRDFNRLFGAQRYNILTGHVTLYYRSPWNGINVAVHAGRYLAGDYGGTIEVTRRFSTGVEIGTWATFTNVPFSKFGEGSFDKGIIIHIPFEWGLPIFSQSAFDLHMNSLTRDGGQRLSGDDSLYTETDRASDGEIADHFDEIVNP